MLKSIKMFILLLILLIACSKNKNVLKIYNDPLEKYFLKYEQIRLEKATIYVPEGVTKYFYIKSYYDFNKDKKPDFIKYHPFKFSSHEFSLNSHADIVVWDLKWFRADVDSDCDGKFDFYMYRDKNDKILIFDFDDEYGKPKKNKNDKDNSGRASIDNIIAIGWSVAFLSFAYGIILMGTDRKSKQ
jgi:hypothetical protein